MRTEKLNPVRVVRTGAHRGWLGLAIVAVVVCMPALAAQQAPTTPTMLRRLAEAVDGHRTGTSVWVIIEADYPNQVVGVFDRLQLAQDSAARFAQDMVVSGPHRASADVLHRSIGRPSLPVDSLVIPGGIYTICVHDGWRSVMEDGRAMCPPWTMARDLVQSINLVFTRTDGVTVSKPIPLSSDALFLSVAAVDKFVLPYYVRTLGVEEAYRMRMWMLAGISGSPVPTQ